MYEYDEVLHISFIPRQDLPCALKNRSTTDTPFAIEYTVSWRSTFTECHKMLLRAILIVRDK